jgi:hypothetical protein
VLGYSSVARTSVNLLQGYVADMQRIVATLQHLALKRQKLLWATGDYQET